MEGSARRIKASLVLIPLLAACAIAPAQSSGLAWPLMHSMLHGASIPGGGSLALDPLLSPATCARGGRVAFVSRIASAMQDQGMFIVDERGLRAIVRSSGPGGGSGVRRMGGDATPIGGTFAGLFEGTAFAPPISDRGDVLFLADVDGGRSTRGLFCAETTTGLLRVVVAVGDAAPGGGAFASVGPGAHLPDGGVLFIARRSGLGSAELFARKGSAIEAFARLGDPLPDGGHIVALATESLSFVDGTSIPIGPMPSTTACGDVAFCARGSGGSNANGINANGIIVRSDGIDAWWAQTGESFVMGSAFVAFGAPVLVRTGEGQLLCAFYADYASTNGPTAAWFVGERGAWRRALGFFDAVDGGQCLGLAISRGPMTPLDSNGDLVVWCDLAIQGGEDRIVRCRADGSHEVLLAHGEPAPGGGVIAELGGWPSFDGAGKCIVAARGTGGAVARAHLVLGDPRLRLSADPCAQPGSMLQAVVHALEPGSMVLAASPVRTSLWIEPMGLLEIGPEPLWLLSGWELFEMPWGCRRANALPDDPQLEGAWLHLQALAFLPARTQLTPAVSAWIRQ